MDLQHFKERMGRRATPQRITVYRIVADLKLYVSASTVYHELRATFPSLSRTTVYKALKYLTERGLLRSHRNADGIMYYAAQDECSDIKILAHKLAAPKMIKNRERRRIFFSEKYRRRKIAEMLNVPQNK